MASIHPRGKGNYLIQFYDKDGRRRGVSLSRTTKRAAEDIARRIELINTANRSNYPIDGATADWIAEIGDLLAEKLVKVGLIKPRSAQGLGGFLDQYIASRKDWKPRTRSKHEATKTWLIRFFGREKALRDITRGDADDFARYLKTDAKVIKSDSTRAKHIANAREYFRAAVRKELIRINPFDGIRVRFDARAEKHYVTTEEATAILAACPDPQWRLVFALARYGGLRMPSELSKLEVGHVLWDKKKILIHSPKTEWHRGKGTRHIPIFPELRRHLEDAFDALPPRSRFLINVTSRNEDGELSAGYIRKRMLQIILLAGLSPWPSLFNSLRSTRETELSNQYPSHKVCAWMGNSRAIADKHYNQVTQADFQEASEGAQEDVEKLMPQLMLKVSETLRKEGIEPGMPMEELLEILGSTEEGMPLHTPQVGQAGLEPATKGL